MYSLGSRGRRAAAVAALALTLGACSSSPSPRGGAPVPPPSPGQASGAPDGAPQDAGSGALKTGDAAVVVWCDTVKSDTPSVFLRNPSVTLASFAMKDGTDIDDRNVVLPDYAETGTVCKNTMDNPSTVAMRQSFDKDFTMIAGTVQGPGGKGRSATAFSIPGAKPADRGQDSGFSSSPDDSQPKFQLGTSTLWYLTTDNQVLSADLSKPGGAPVRRATAKKQGYALAGDHAWVLAPLMSTMDNVVVNPSGTVAAAVGDEGAALWGRDDPADSSGDYVYETERYFRAARFGDRPAMPGGEQVPQCVPQLWFDDTDLLCTSKDSMLRVRFSADHASVAGVDTLLPATDRTNRDPVLSPDGKSLAFLSVQGEQTDLYKLDLTRTGAQPVKVRSVPKSTPTATESSRIHLVAWQ